MAYAIARLKKLKRSNIAGSASHANRERETPNADPRRENIRFIGSNEREERLEDLVLAKIGEHEQKRKIRADGVYCVELLLSASASYFRPDWEVEIEVIELYLKLIYKKISLAANCPGTSNYQELSFRQQYLELVKLVLSEIINYEELYSSLVALAPNLLIAQELDLYIYKSLKLNSNYELMKIIEQGLILQTFKSITDNLAEFNKQRYLEIFYFQILECFSGD